MRLTAGMTAGDALAAITAEFRSAGLPTPDLDARFLVQGVLEIDAAALFVDRTRILGAAAMPLSAAVERRLANEPVSRILGWRDFYGRRFAISPAVLDPRADTETVIDLALAIAGEKGWRERPIRIADIGTGSGILACTLLAELPQATAVATDISAAAVDVAMANARSLGVEARLTAIVTRGLAGAEGVFDLIVSNPPYIATADLVRLDLDVRGFDPAMALDGGPDGLAIYWEIAIEIRRLRSPTVIVLEFGVGQAEAVTALFADDMTAAPRFGCDLGGHTRCVALEIHR